MEIILNISIIINIVKKQRFNSKGHWYNYGEFQNNWEDINAVPLGVNSRPMFTLANNSIAGSGSYQTGAQLRYAKDFNAIQIVSKGMGTSGNLQFIWMPQQNNAVYESKDFTIDQPVKVL